MKSTAKKISRINPDLPETKDDKEHLRPDEGILNLPDVKDIPGQEHIRVPKLKEFADITISSDDEEGAGILDEESEDPVAEAPYATHVSREEKKALRDAAEKTTGVMDEEALEQARLDQRDDEGELLNENTDRGGSELDIPGSEEDDANEEIGEEDEENNSYSLDGEDEDESISKQ